MSKRKELEPKDIQKLAKKLKEEKEEGEGNESIRPERIRIHCTKDDEKGNLVIYWMSRDQRVKDNWALLHAQNLALEKNACLVVVFSLLSEFLGATYRQFAFMLKGLQEVQQDLMKLSIPFVLLQGKDSVETVAKFIREEGVSLVVTDSSPLRIAKEWKQRLKDLDLVTLHEVDAHNIVPVWIASEKQEYSARTIRSKINKLLPTFLEEFPAVKMNSKVWKSDKTNIDWEIIFENLRKTSDTSVPEVTWLQPGEKAAGEQMKKFLTKKLKSYSDRNDPTLDTLSDLSPYLHYGHISPQRVVLESGNYKTAHPKEYASFVEELVIRRELAENFCFYNSKYDSFEGFPEWAKHSLNLHRKDKRPIVYTKKELEEAKTYDSLWNASQIQMVTTGKMHGFMRMYWAKKILEWTNSPEEALEICIYLNDKYELDGREPSGYVGCAWSVGGVHDQGWKERPIFGKIRYMNYEGCKRKFQTEKYIAKFTSKSYLKQFNM